MRFARRWPLAAEPGSSRLKWGGGAVRQGVLPVGDRRAVRGCDEDAYARLDSVCFRHHDAPVRTTLDIKDATLAELKAKARVEDRPLKEVVEETLQVGLAARRHASHRFQVKPLNPGIKPAFRGQSMNQLYDELAAEEARP